MTTSNPDILIRSGGDNGLVWTIGASALIHFGALAVIAFAPQRLLGPPPRLESYTTVELIAPAAVGGTNLVRGPGAGKQPVSAPKPPVAAAKAEMEDVPGAVAVPDAAPNKPAPAAPPAKVEEPPKAEAVPPPKPPEPVKAAPPKPAAVPEVPKAIEPPKPVAKAEPPKAPAPAAKKPEAQPIDKPAAPPKAKVVPPPESAKPAPAAPAKVAKAAPVPPPAAPPLDQQIAAAVQRKAQQVKAGSDPSAVPADVDQRISAAVRRRVQDAARGAATGVRSTATTPGSGGPVGYGPGTEPGGKVVGEAYVRYLAHMQERIKATWAWAGANSSLKVVVHFNITATGELINIRTIESSGDPTYDASVERAVRAASPLDPPPAEYQEQFSTVELEFLADELRS